MNTKIIINVQAEINALKYFLNYWIEKNWNIVKVGKFDIDMKTWKMKTDAGKRHHCKMLHMTEVIWSFFSGTFLCIFWWAENDKKGNICSFEAFWEEREHLLLVFSFLLVHFLISGKLAHIAAVTFALFRTFVSFAYFALSFISQQSLLTWDFYLWRMFKERVYRRSNKKIALHTF